MTVITPKDVDMQKSWHVQAWREHDVRISTKNYLVSEKESLEIVNLELLDDTSPKLNILPILATGNDMFNVMGINILIIIIPVQ